MTTTARAGRRAAGVLARVLSPALVWAVALILSPIVEPGWPDTVLWGLGAAVLICLVPWVIVTWLDKRNDLRRGINRLGMTPVVIAAGVLMYGTLRTIRWLDGPLGLAAVIFAVYAGYAVLLLFRRHLALNWAQLTYGGAAVVLILLLGPPGLIALPVLALGAWARWRVQGATAGRAAAGKGRAQANKQTLREVAVSLLIGALVCGGTYAALLQAVLN